MAPADGHLETKTHDAITGTTAVVIVAGGSAIAANQTSNAGAILTFVGAITVAVIAAWTAERRQARQLDAEAQRQVEALDAERGRLLATLAHERALADLADARDLLSETVEHLERALRVIERAVDLLLLNEGRGSPRPVAQESANAIPDDLEQAADGLKVLWSRVRVRFELGDPIPDSLNDAIETVEVLASTWGSTDEEDIDARDALNAYEDALVRFHAAASAVAGVRQQSA